jgi:cytidylate kinase
MALITVSRHFGAGGHTLGENLRDRFGFQLVDEPFIDELALKCSVSPGWLTAMEKEASSTLLSMISSFLHGGPYYNQPATRAEREERKKYVAFLTQIFTEMASQGGYIIVGRGAQFILKDHPKALHVLLVANYESRIAFLVDRHNLSRPEAARMIRAREKERARLASCLFGANIDDISLYNIVLNTSLMPYEWVVESVSGLVTRFIDRESSSAAPSAMRGSDIEATHEG